MYVKSKRYNKKYGTLTKDVYKQKTVYQRAYHSLFVFYRILLTVILVYMHKYPLYQISIFSIMQVMMIAYLIKFRPFRSELIQIFVVTDELTIIVGLLLLYFMWEHQNNIQNSLNV